MKSEKPLLYGLSLLSLINALTCVVFIFQGPLDFISQVMTFLAGILVVGSFIFTSIVVYKSKRKGLLIPFLIQLMSLTMVISLFLIDR
jgi:hypothetical protein